MNIVLDTIIGKDLEINTRVCEFKDREVEDLFCSYKLTVDKKLLQLILIITILAIAAISISDFYFIRSKYWSESLLSGRMLTFFVLSIFLTLVCYIKTKLQLSWLVYSFVFYILFKSTFLTHGEHFISHSFYDVIIILCLYFSTLITFRKTVLLCLLYSLSAIFIASYNIEMEANEFNILILSHFIVNTFGIFISLHENKLKRELFAHKVKMEFLAKELNHQASIDVLTSLPNRRAFDNDYKTYLSLVPKNVGLELGPCIAIADIDYFKDVNDTHGHEVGDAVLKAFSGFLTRQLRCSDNVYRFGGEEFILVLTNCSVENAATLIESVIEKLTINKFDIDGLYLNITASFGLTVLRQETSKSVISRADAALYRAKETGRNKLVTML